MNGVSGYQFGSDPSNIAQIITFSFFMSSKPQKDSLHESSEEATARRKRTLAELKQLSKCYRHNSDLLHATFALRALRSDMRKKCVVVQRSRKLMLRKMMAMNCTAMIIQQQVGLECIRNKQSDVDALKSIACAAKFIMATGFRTKKEVLREVELLVTSNEMYMPTD